MSKKVYLAILWHQHQPFYKDLKTGQAIMPWVRLHATKDYYDMAAILDRYPNIRLTINLVPSLLVQLKDYADGKCSDPWLDKTLLPAKSLSNEDKEWILENFFYCNWDTMIFANPRFGELFEKRGKLVDKEEIKRKRTYFSEQDFLDLQVWFNLAWMDPYWKDADPLVDALYKKERNFTEREKLDLMALQRKICGMVIEKHKELWHKGQIEISTTPFYHPILPLLCDTDAAQMSMPGSLRPQNRFQHSEDAKAQVQRALDYMEQVFGKRPVGMWPSEGSVSDQAIGILSEMGVRWAATDEAVLFNSLRMMGEKDPYSRESLYQPYRVAPASQGGGQAIQMVFRDHSLSDAIGFVYSRNDPEKAVDDLLGHLERIGEASPVERPLVSIILDGENCWEYYPNDGNDFLKALYQRLSNHPRIETTTVGGFLDRHPAERSLNQLWASSWINSDFSIWIGHPEDNLAWDQLKEARDFLVQRSPQPDPNNENSRLAWESLYIAEGSDWCWWYGDQNSTAQDEVFDQLFRRHLTNVYTFMGSKAPEKLNFAIKRKELKGRQSLPVDLFTPKIDGLRTTYYEWRAGGYFQQAAAPGGAMHQAKNFLSSIYYGFDLEKLYVRLDPIVPFQEQSLNGYQIKITFLEPRDREILIELESQGKQPRIAYARLKSPSGPVDLSEAAVQKILELAVPFKTLGSQPKQTVEFVIQVLENWVEIENWPHQTSVRFKQPDLDYSLDYWSV